MKKYIKVLALAITAGCIAFHGGNAFATSVTKTFDDTTINFPSYNTYTQDLIGTSPAVKNMSITWDDTTGLLQTIKIQVGSSGIQNFDSLFINTDYGDSDTDVQGWDYFVHSGGTTNSWNTVGAVPGNGIYEVADRYDYTTVKAGVGGRTGHANGIDASDLMSMGDLTRTYNSTSYVLTWSFTNYSINLGNNFAIGYTPWCANDVILVTNKENTVVPEPATMLLFGAGLAGIGGLRARKNKK